MSEREGSATPSASGPLNEEMLAGRQKIEEAGAKFAFEKVLTTSDANGGGRIVIPKGLAEAHFPEVEAQTGMNLQVTDTTGKRHTFRFRFWINNQSRMYLLEGTQEVQAKFNLGIGDVLVFGRMSDGSFVIHGRKGTKDDVSRKPPGKRSSGEGTNGKEGGSGKGGGKGGRSRGTESAKSKRMKQAAAQQQVASSYEYWAGASVPPRKDGVFRALPNSFGQDGNNRVVAQYGSWSAVISLAGELYQAFFDSYDAAAAALEAAVQGDAPAAASIVPPPAAPVPRSVEVPATTAPPVVAAA